LVQVTDMSPSLIAMRTVHSLGPKAMKSGDITLMVVWSIHSTSGAITSMIFTAWLLMKCTYYLSVRSLNPIPLTVHQVLPVMGPKLGSISETDYGGPTIFDTLTSQMSDTHLLSHPPKMTSLDSL